MMMMLLQEKMNLMRASCFVFLVVLLCRSVVICSGYQRREENVFLSQLVDPMTEEVNEELAKLLWISCRVDLIHLKQVVEDEYNLRSQSWDANLKNLENVLHLHLKTKLLDCIRENNLLFDIIREEGGSYITSYLESLFTSLDAPQQNLGRRLRRSAAEIPGPVSGPAPAPVPASGHTPTSVPAPTKPFFPFYSTPPPPLLFDEDSSATSGSDAEGPATKNNQPVIIAVAITAAVTFLFAALLFFCCMKCYWKRSAVRQNDESPLLSLSMTDYSIGSVNSVNGEKFGHQSLVYNSSHDMKASSFDGKQNLDSNIMHASIDEHASLGAVGPALKPPPGRVVANPPGMPPLKPPPGRVQPLPPERPAYLRVSASSTGPPVPPPPPAPVPPPRPTPPVPPPPMKPSSSAGPPPPRPPAPPTPGAPPPPPPKAGPGPPRPPPPLGSKIPRPPPGLKSNTASGAEAGTESDADHKAKLKPFFWDKVLANPDSSMVWHQIKAGSFQFNEEMIETLFGYTAPDKNKPERKKESSSVDLGPQYIQIIDHKKSQNLSIMLRALNVTIEEVCDALIEGNELPVEFLQALLKMAPTSEEELKLRLFTGEVSQLGPADRFLKVLVEIPFSFKRIEALLFMCTLEEEVAMTKESFQTLEVACKELRNSRLFLKLLEAVLKTGNRMNNGTFRGGAQAFKLDTLLKLADVKGTDGKTTLLHFVVQEIIRTEGVRAARAMRESQSFSSVKTEDLLKEVSHDTEDHYGNLGLQVVSRLSSELENVKKASALDAEGLTGSVAKLNYSLSKTRNFLNSDMKSLEEDSGFHETLKSFVENAEGDVKWLVEEEKRIMGVVKSTGDYFHGNAGKDEGLRLFTIVRDFLVILDKVCRELREAPKKPAKTLKKESSTASTSSDIRQNFIDPRQKLFPAIAERRMDYSSSDDDMS